MGAWSDTGYVTKVDTELHVKDERIGIILNLFVSVGNETGTKSYAMEWTQ